MFVVSWQNRKSTGGVVKNKGYSHGQGARESLDPKKYWTFIIAPALISALLAIAVVLGER